MTATAKVFLSIFFGVGLGIMVGLELRETASWLLWVAPIIGGVFSYIAVDFPGAIRAIPVAFATMRNAILSKRRFEIYRWRFYTMLTIWLYQFLLSFFVVSLKPPHPNRPSEVLILTTALGVCAILFFVLYWSVQHPSRQKEALEESRKEAIFISPYHVIFRHIPRVLWLLVSRFIPQFFTVAIPWCVKQIYTFVVHWFKLVHSNRRIVCLAYAFLFTGLGLIIGGPSPLIWMVAGGLLGVVNYQLISVRWLKLVPVVDLED